MGNSIESRRRRRGFRAFARTALSLVAIGFVAALLAGPSAHASSGLGNRWVLSEKCSSPTDPYGSSTTIADCDTSTTAEQETVTLTISYRNGVVDWRSCAGKSASGSLVQLYINGTLEDSSQAGPGGCTPHKDLALCLNPGNYNATAVDQPYGQGSAVLTVENSGCANPVVLASTQSGSGSLTGSARHSGGLAFTGSNIALLVIAATALMTLGIVILKMARQRRNAD